MTTTITIYLIREAYLLRTQTSPTTGKIVPALTKIAVDLNSGQAWARGTVPLGKLNFFDYRLVC